ncbi:hypothetical protein HanIR_Chr01g0038371 [Helianthus annuus]|nr:hypothetical protein HanIR_Chr01g0038371 [Helianthus annuus]
MVVMRKKGFISWGPHLCSQYFFFLFCLTWALSNTLQVKEGVIKPLADVDPTCTCCTCFDKTPRAPSQTLQPKQNNYFCKPQL